MNNNENNVSLSDLANGAIPTATPVGMPVKPKLNTANVREANISEVVRPSEPEVIEGTGNPMLDKAFLGIDSTIARLQSETDTTYQKGEEERIEKAIDSDDGDIDSIDDTLSSATASTVVVHNFNETSEPVTIKKTVEVSAPVAGTKTENIVMVKDESVYDADEHLFDGIDDEDMKYLDEEDESESDNEESEDEKAKTEEIKETIIHEVNKTLVVINDDYKKMVQKDEAKSTPYSVLNEEVENLTNRLGNMEEDFDKALKSLGNMYDDEVRAREQLDEIQEFLKTCI